MLNILKLTLGILGSLFVLLAVLELPAELKGLTVEERDATLSNAKLGLMTNFTIFIVILGSLLIAAFFVFDLITNPKKSLKAVLGYALAALAFGIMYAMAGGSATPMSDALGIDQSTIKATEAGLYLTIFMVIIGFALILVGPLFKNFKK